jgi:hypothetical protein
MFVGDEVRADVSFALATARLAGLAVDSLAGLADGAWGDGLARVGPAGSVPGLSKLVQVQVRELVQRDQYAQLTLRWQATGALGGLFPVLDADITLIPDGDDATLIGLAGVYGPPGGVVGAGLDRAVLHRVATATIRSFLARIAAVVALPEPGEADGVPRQARHATGPPHFSAAAPPNREVLPASHLIRDPPTGGFRGADPYCSPG